MTAGLNDPTQQMEKKADLRGMIFIATVVDNNDPTRNERVRIKIPGLFSEDTPDDYYPWAIPISSRIQGMKAEIGTFGVPDIGAEVFVMFQNGDPHLPIYLGGVKSVRSVISEAIPSYPNRYGGKDKQGSYLYVDTQVGDLEIFHHTGYRYRIEANGDVNIQEPANKNETISQNLQVTVGGNVTVNISGNANVTVGGTCNVSSGGAMTLTAPTIDLN